MTHTADNTVFRGHSRSSARGSNRGGSNEGPGAAGQAARVTSADEAVVDEELQRLQREAEQRGYEMGRDRAEAELRAAVDGASALAEKLHEIAPERTSEIAHSIAELALSVAKRIIQHEVRIEPSLLCTSLEAAVSTINGSPEAHVLLNPSAVEPVATAWEALHGRHYLGKSWFFEGDPTLPVGGCTLRYEHGFVEAGLESQLEEIGIALDRAIPNLARGTVEEEVA
jgi:flagellar assembly protein FliH